MEKRYNSTKPSEVSASELDQAARIRCGDQATFNRLFHLHYEPLCRFAYGYVNALEVAEDLVQDIFLDLWRRRRSWYPDRSVKAYLYGAVRNQALKHLRRMRARRCMEDEQKRRALPVYETPVSVLNHQEVQRATQQAINELPERRRHIFILSRQHDLTYVEIATLLDISVKTVETQVGRALKFLRNRLGSHRDGSA